MLATKKIYKKKLVSTKEQQSAPVQRSTLALRENAFWVLNYRRETEITRSKPHKYNAHEINYFPVVEGLDSERLVNDGTCRLAELNTNNFVVPEDFNSVESRKKMK